MTTQYTQPQLCIRLWVTREYGLVSSRFCMQRPPHIMPSGVVCVFFSLITFRRQNEASLSACLNRVGLQQQQQQRRWRRTTTTTHTAYGLASFINVTIARLFHLYSDQWLMGRILFLTGRHEKLSAATQQPPPRRSTPLLCVLVAIVVFCLIFQWKCLNWPITEAHSNTPDRFENTHKKKHEAPGFLSGVLAQMMFVWVSEKQTIIWWQQLPKIQHCNLAL